MPEIIKVIGPPGTGKSTELLRLITQDAEQFGSSLIGAVSFTTSAVHTIADRIVQAGFDVPDNVRTIHSHCYRLLGIKDGEVADTKKHLTEFGSRYPHWKMSEKTESIEDRGTTEEQVTGEAKRLRVNDQLFNNMQVLRNRLAPLDQWPDFEKEIYRDWKEFMQDEGLIDFTGMMERVLENELMVYLDSLFVDEAQDLSALSMAILMMWAGNTKRTTLLGDSNQAIFRFSGSAPEVFMGLLANKTTILEQSYRVSPRILDYSQSIIRQVSQREDAEYRPCMDYGPGEVIFGVDEPDLSLPGTHMILGRTHRETEYWIKRLLAWGVVWHNPLRREDKRWNPTDTTAWKAYHAFKRLQNGESLYGAEVQELVASMKARGNLARGTKARIENWDNMRICRKYSPMDLYDEGFTDNWLDGDIPLTEWLARESGISEHVERLYTTEQPRTIVGTCHSAKGGEADHVWVDMRISKTQYNRLMGQHGEQSTWDDECRLAYVAATRAKKTLGLMLPDGQGKIFNKCFPQD